MLNPWLNFIIVDQKTSNNPAIIKQIQDIDYTFRTKKDSNYAYFLQALIVVALGLLGLLLIALLFRELLPLFQALFSTSISKSNAQIMDEIIVFFLFFEFTAMIISALLHHGHTSLEFLLGLGATALVRGLITHHSNIEETIGIAVAILILIVSMAIFHKYIKDEM